MAILILFTTQAQQVLQNIKNHPLPKKAPETTIFEKAKEVGKEWAGGFEKDYKEHGALGMIPHRISDGFEGIDSVTFDKVKDPVKNISKKIDKALDDGIDDGKLSVTKYAWNGVKSVGNVADALVSKHDFWRCRYV